MGLAPYGKPRFVDKVRKLIQASGRRFWLDMRLLRVPPLARRAPTTASSSSSSARRATPTGSSSRRAVGLSRPTSATSRRTTTRMAERNQHYADIAASVQQVHRGDPAVAWRAPPRETGLKNLCLAGGVALNGVANARILRETPSTSSTSSPRPATAAARSARRCSRDHHSRPPRAASCIDHPYSGQEYGDAELGDVPARPTASPTRVATTRTSCSTASSTLAAGQIVGWFQGRRVGPARARHRAASSPTRAAPT